MCSKRSTKTRDHCIPIVNFLFVFNADVPQASTCGVYISKFVRFVLVYSDVLDFVERCSCITGKSFKEVKDFVTTNYLKLLRNFSTKTQIWFESLAGPVEKLFQNEKRIRNSTVMLFKGCYQGSFMAINGIKS